MTRFCLFALMLAALLITPPALAADKAAAESLFRAGKEQMDAGNYAEACLKFKESNEAEPSVGALLNLALCNQKQGKIASAWAHYREAETLARNRKDSRRERGAAKLAAELEPKLSRLTVNATVAHEGLTVTRNGERISSIGTSLPVDPGNYEIVASAPGFDSWTTQLAVSSTADSHTLTIPELVARPGGATSSDGPAWQTIVGWSLVGLGAVGIAVGIGAGVAAIGKTNDVEDACQGKRCITDEGKEALDDANLFADLSTIGIGVGVAAAVGGVILLLVAPSDTISVDDGGDVALVPMAGPDVAGLTAVGRF